MYIHAHIYIYITHTYIIHLCVDMHTPRDYNINELWEFGIHLDLWKMGKI